MRVNDDRKGFTNFLNGIKINSIKSKNKTVKKYHGEIGIVMNIPEIKLHPDPKIAALAGKIVKIFPETKEAVTHKGKFIGNRIQVLPITPVNPDATLIGIMADFVQTDDKFINEQIKKMGVK